MGTTVAGTQVNHRVGQQFAHLVIVNMAHVGRQEVSIQFLFH